MLITFCGFVSGCEALVLSGRAACTKPLLAAVFLFEFQRVKKYFEISLKKVCSYQNRLYICISN